MNKLLAALLLLLAACAAPQRPSGKVELGFTPEMVANALGKPDKKYALVSKEDDLQIWAYSMYRTPFDVSGEKELGPTPRNVPGGGIQGDERLRVVFRAGHVVLVEDRSR